MGDFPDVSWSSNAYSSRAKSAEFNNESNTPGGFGMTEKRVGYGIGKSVFLALLPALALTLLVVCNVAVAEEAHGAD